jgi:preprotein translocase subunit SecD
MRGELHSRGMRRALVVTLLGVTVLAACSGQFSMKYTAMFTHVDAAKSAVLIESIERVIIRKFAALGIEQKEVRVTVVPTGEAGAEVTVHVPDDPKIVETAEAILSEQLTFDIRIEKEQRPDGEETTDNWIPTALTGSSLLWAQAQGNSKTGEIFVELQLSAEGRQKMHEVFTTAKGKNVGIFVRGLLVSKLRVSDAPLADTVAIGPIPNDRVAEIFADDLNVGLRVTFTPAP